MESTFYQLQSDEASTSAEKDALTVRQNATMDARYAIQEQEASIKGDQAEQKQLLSISKGNEAAYTALVNQKTAEAAQIRAALFPLASSDKKIPVWLRRFSMLKQLPPRLVYAPRSFWRFLPTNQLWEAMWEIVI